VRGSLGDEFNDDTPAPREKGLAGMRGITRTRGFRGFQLLNATVDQVVICTAQTHSRPKLAERGLPYRFVWPVFNDLQGASLLVSAVLDQDVAAIRRMERMHPMADFGLGEWWITLKARFLEEAAVDRRTLKTKQLRDGSTLTLEVETLAATGVRRIQAVLLRAGNRVSSTVLFSERFAPA